MIEEDKLSYSEIVNLASDLKVVTAQIFDLIENVKENYYSKISDNGAIWTGDVSKLALDTFEDLSSRVPKFVELTNNYSDYIVKSMEK